MADKETGKTAKAVQVPKEEDIKIIEMGFSEVLLGLAGLATLSGLGYMFYSRVKVKAEIQKYEAVSDMAASVMGSIAEVMATSKEDHLLDVAGGSQIKKTPARKKPRVKKVVK